MLETSHMRYWMRAYNLLHPSIQLLSCDHIYRLDDATYLVCFSSPTLVLYENASFNFFPLCTPTPNYQWQFILKPEYVLNIRCNGNLGKCGKHYLFWQHRSGGFKLPSWMINHKWHFWFIQVYIVEALQMLESCHIGYQFEAHDLLYLLKSLLSWYP